ncbi:polysaccharide polymerase, partial [Streptococcus anginosus]
LYVLQSWKSYKQGNYLLLAILSLVSVNCMIEAFWIRPSYDIFMYIMFASITFPKKESELED